MKEIKKILCLSLMFALLFVTTLPVYAMQLSVEITNGDETITLEVEPTDRIEDVKVKIQEQTGIPIDRQKLSYGEKTLENGSTLQDHSIQRGSTLKLEANNKDSLEVRYSVDPTYTVTIPESVELGETATISAENVVVASGKRMAVTLTGTSGDNDSFTLKSAEGAVIDYTVQDANKQPVSLGGTVLTVNPANGATGEATLSFIAPTSVTYAGHYTGTVTFTISVVDVQS